MSKTDSQELHVLINLDREDHEETEEPDHVLRASTPIVIRKKMQTFEKVGAREIDAFVDAAIGSETEKERVKRTCCTETTDAESRARSNSFHFSAKHGFTEVVTRMMAMGFTKLLSDDSRSPVEVAVDEEHYDTAEVLLRRMEKKRAIKFFKRHGGEKPRISLFKLLNDLGDLQKKDDEENEEKALQLQQFLLAVLDTTVSELEVDLELLEADENGIVPAEETFEKGPDATTCYSIIVLKKLKELQKHESFGALVEKKWRNYGRVAQCLIFAVYMVTVTFLTISLVLAARSSDPNDYSRPIDGFRLFCEIITFLLVLLDTLLEIKDFYQSYKNSGEHKSPCCDNCMGCQYFWSAVKKHFQSATNLLDFFALLTVWLIIPCRIADSDGQWVFAAITYILHGLRIFKHAIMFWSVAVYVRILLKIITRDLPQFIVVIVVVLIAFGGGLYFALRGRTHTPGSGSGSDEFDPVDDTDLGLFPDDTREIHLAWLTGFRILTEGSVLDYYGKDGPGEYGVLGAIIYWLFVFTVTIILLSLLIAQFSVSFQEHKESAEEDVLISRMNLLQQLHIIIDLWPINKICCHCCPQKTVIQNTFLLKKLQKLQTICGKIRQQYRWILGRPEFNPDLRKIKRSESKAQKSRGKYKLVARQERLEVETLQCTVQEIWKTLKDMQPKDAPDKE